MSSQNNPAIVILGNSAQALGIIRSAKDLNIPAIILNDVHFCSSRFSNYANKYIRLPRNTIRNLANSSSNDFLVNELLSLPVNNLTPLFGINEDIIKFFAKYRSKLSQKYFIPQNKLDHIFDKYEFNKLSPEQNRIETYLLNEINLENFVNRPFIIKSRRGNKLRNHTGKKAISTIKLENSTKELLKKYFHPDEIIIQKVISSSKPVKSSCALSTDGEIIGLFQYEKLRQHPDQFGTGTYLKSIFEEELKTLSEEVLKKLLYTGISEIEFIYDNEKGNYKAIEMNPRTWKSINFSAQCGQNLVEKYIKYIINQPFSRTLDYKTDQYWVDLFTDISQMFREKKIFNYKSKNLFECTWDKKDPLPFLLSIFFAPLILLKV